MRWLTGTVVFSLALPLASIPVSAQPVTTRFETGLEGWLAFDGVNFTNEVKWSPNDGNPGACARFGDSVDGTTYHIAPPEFLGDWSALDGIGLISYDQKVFDLGDTPVVNAYEIVIAGPGGLARYHEEAVMPDLMDWTTIIAPLTENQWSLEQGSWAALLDDVTGVAIRAELIDFSRDVTCLDNVLLGIPEPTTLCLLSAGAWVVLRRRR